MKGAPHAPAPAANAPDAAGAPHFCRQRMVRFSDCDPAGIVFYPQYFVMFNGLVEDWVTDGLGVDFHDLIAVQRIGLPTVRLEVDFRAVSRMGDAVQLALRVERVGGSSITLHAHCMGVDGVERLRMRQVLVCTSLETHRAIAIPPALKAALGRLPLHA